MFGQSGEIFSDCSDGVFMARTKQTPVAGDGKTAVFVSPWTFGKFGMKPHVQLSVGAAKSADRPMAELAPADARRVAIALLEAAEKADDAGSK
jgi:hypothetical protein